ncbi:hypothetical protein [Flavobacterium sp. FlaQc-30]|uniref:hypothetical protein n=1 Tax=Flavobacterium sp. FlaQc-30 TaxID=3374179 RepID=UPI003757A8E1
MKKLLTLFLGFTILSCSSEDQVNQEVSALENSGSVLDGKMLSFQSEESFVREYSYLATLNKEELQKWISSKGLVSMLNTSDNSIGIEEDVISESRLVYSAALESILNAESKLKIAGKVFWLNERSFYLLSENEINLSVKELVEHKSELEKFGELLSISGASKSLTGRMVLPNENRVKTFASAEMNVSGSRLRHVVDLYNETILLNGSILTSEMFLRSTLQYRSCSTLGGCKWKEAFNPRYLRSNFIGLVGDTVGVWTVGNIYTSSTVTGTQTYHVGHWAFKTPTHSNSNFVISGPITCSLDIPFPTPEVSIDISWY